MCFSNDKMVQWQSLGNGKQVWCSLSACNQMISLPGRVAHSVTCLATDASLTADPGGREFDPGPVPYFRGD